MLELITLASGSSGNCTLITDGGTHILIDAGISCRRITTALRELGVDAAGLSGVLITHEHTDHVSGLTTMNKKYGLPVYATAGTARQLCYRIPFLEENVHTVRAGEAFAVGTMEVTAFRTSHDAAESVGYTVTAGEKKIAFATDLGYLSDTVRAAVDRANLAVIEANHDVETLLSGPYPYYLKDRILGSQGHLSNELGGELACWAAERGAHTIVLAHLSHENNTPAMALNAVGTALSAAGYGDVLLSAAPRCEPGPRIQV